jgi:hypothetical protein
MKLKITRTQLYSSTGPWVFAAWMPSKVGGNHSTVMSFGDGQLWGKIGTDPDPALFQHLSAYPDGRYEACEAAHKKRCELAYQLIIQAYPEAAKGERVRGEIISYEETMKGTCCRCKEEKQGNIVEDPFVTEGIIESEGALEQIDDIFRGKAVLLSFWCDDCYKQRSEDI